MDRYEKMDKKAMKNETRKESKRRKQNIWWDRDCRIKKKEVMEKLYRWKNEKEGRKDYLKSKQEYKWLIQRKKRESSEKWTKEIEEDRSGQKFWKEINKERKKKMEISDKITEQEWLEHFRLLSGGKAKKEITENEQEEEGEEISMKELDEAIRKLKKNKAAGQDGIQNEAWIHGGKKIKEELRKELNEIWKGKGLPDEWKTGIIVPIFKKGDKDKAENYRGITLMDTGYKIYAEILRNRLENFAEEEKKLDDTQMGFRKKRGTMDAIYVLRCAIDKEIRREKGKVFVVFADMKAAFDKISRNEIRRVLNKMKVEKRLKNRILELYEDTRCTVRIGEKEIGSFYTNKGVRQGCPLSALIFNIIMADLEERMSRIQEGGIVLGRKKIWSISYADDIAMMANNIEAIREMIARLGRYLKDKGLQLNAEKTKVMRFRKAGGRRSKEKVTWEGKEIEEVKKFNYLGYELKENNDDEAQIEKLVGKAKVILGKVWSIGERKFKDDWNLRIKLFDSLVEGILMYGAECWGWKEWKKLESIQEKFIKWTMKLDRRTPGYLLRSETKRNKLHLRAAIRAIRFEEKLRRLDENSIRGECFRLLEKGNENTRQEKIRKEFFRNKGWSLQEVNRKRANEEGIEEDIKQIMKDIQIQQDREKIRDTRYAEELKILQKEDLELPEYLRRNGNKKRNQLEMIGRFRLGTESKNCKYWEREEERRCRLCNEQKENVKHIIEDCRMTGREDAKWEVILDGSNKNINVLHEILWRRKRAEMQENTIE